jgi:hypothetical protein
VRSFNRDYRCLRTAAEIRRFLAAARSQDKCPSFGQLHLVCINRGRTPIPIFDDPTKGVRKRGAELDALIVQRCTERSLILVTRNDKGTIGEARASGSITVLTPEEYAAARLSRGQARQRFMERLCIGAIHRIVDATPEARQRTIEEMKVIVGTYRSAWQDPRVRPANPPLSLEWPWRTEF